MFQLAETAGQLLAALTQLPGLFARSLGRLLLLLLLIGELLSLPDAIAPRSQTGQADQQGQTGQPLAAATRIGLGSGRRFWWRRLGRFFRILLRIFLDRILSCDGVVALGLLRCLVGVYFAHVSILCIRKRARECPGAPPAKPRFQHRGSPQFF